MRVGNAVLMLSLKPLEFTLGIGNGKEPVRVDFGVGGGGCI